MKRLISLLLPLFLVFVAVEPARADKIAGKIAFVSTRNGNEEIYVMTAEGTQQVRVTNLSSDPSAPSIPYEPHISPNGKKVAFVALGNDREEIYIVNADGTGPTLLTHGATAYSICFSPDGKKITFISYRTGNAQIYTMNADGTGQTRLTSGNMNYGPTWVSGFVLSPKAATVKK